jgi:carbon-monoxide dehydrogenase medium subunit
MNYLFPATVEDAVDILTAHDGRARIIAGGTDLMLRARDGGLDALTLVDITRIAGLDRIEIGSEWITVGAAVTFAMLRDSAFLRGRVCALVRAAESVGAAPIQAMATWLGNIAQAMPAADGGIIAVALDAQARVAGATGARWVAVEALYREAKTSALDSTRQMVSHLRFPAPRAGWGCAWQRSGRRPSLTLPILNCAATLRLASRDGTIEAATLALGPVAALPYRARDVEEFLIGRPPEDESFGQAAAMAQAECHPRSNPLRASGEYRHAIIPTLVRDALREAREHARASYGD